MTGFELLLLKLSGRASPLALAIALWALALVGAVLGWWEPQWRWGVYMVFTLLAVWSLTHWTRAVRERYIRESVFPQILKRRLRDAYPNVTPKDCDLAERGLRQFFLACLRSRGSYVAMPSRAVDAMWHAFTQNATAYQNWCRDALGFVPEYAPAVVLGKKEHHNDGLRRAWYWACKDEAIQPRTPSRLPLLFALDAKLAIPDGFHYLPGTLASGQKPKPGSTDAHHYGTSFCDTSYSGRATDFGGCESHGGKNSDNDSHGDSDGDGDGGGDGGGGD